MSSIKTKNYIDEIPTFSQNKKFIKEVKEHNIQEVRRLLQNKNININININFQDSNGKTALIYALTLFERNDIECAMLLLDAGADPNIQDSDGKTALMYAIRYRHENIIIPLLDAIADPNIQDKWGETALIWATKHSNNNNILKLLLKAGANINHKNKNGYTALIYAVLNENKSCVKLLIENGANPNIKNKYNLNALDICIKHIYNINREIDFQGEEEHSRELLQNMYDIVKMLKNAMKIYPVMSLLTKSFKKKSGLPLEITGKLISEYLFSKKTKKKQKKSKKKSKITKK